MTDEDDQGTQETYTPRDKLGRVIRRGTHFDPLSEYGGQVPVSAEIQRRLDERASVSEETDRIAAHLQLPGGRLPDDERSDKLSRQERESIWRDLRDYPPIPPNALRELERIIGAYGLPLMEMSSEKAAFVVRRVMSDYHRVRVLRRNYATKALFTPDELLQLMRTLKLRPWQLAEVVDPDRQHTVNAAIHRWLAGLHAPTGRIGSGYAYKITRLIEQHVRRPSKARAVSEQSGAQKRRRRERVMGEGMSIPLATASRRKEEEDDPRVVE